MNVTVAENAGFCPGVKRADITIRRLIENKAENERIYTLGHLIHNQTYTDFLSESGVKTIEADDIERIVTEYPDIMHTVVIRTHGITRELDKMISDLKSKYGNLKTIDMTCPSVKKIHRIAEDNTSDNTVFLLFCNKDHPEAIGIMSYANGEKYAIHSAEEIIGIDFSEKIPILCSQTTENLEEYKKNKKILKNLLLYSNK